jgi:hypothetical protein
MSFSLLPGKRLPRLQTKNQAHGQAKNTKKVKELIVDGRYDLSFSRKVPGREQWVWDILLGRPC